MAETKYGKRIFTEINRPDRELVEKFRGIPSSNISDMMNRMFNMYGDLRCYTKGANMVGTALTVHVAEGDNALLHLAMDLAKPGDVIVLDGSGCMSRALCGEIMFNYAKSKGIAGFVLDGCIRDADALDDLGFPVYAKGITPQGPWKIGYGEINRSSSPATSSSATLTASWLSVPTWPKKSWLPSGPNLPVNRRP